MKETTVTHIIIALILVLTALLSYVRIVSPEDFIDILLVLIGLIFGTLFSKVSSV